MPRINFEKLTKSEQRVVIAKDLIARLDANEFTAQQGTYLSVRLTKADLRDESAEVRDVLKGKKCKGCQIGGLFLCAVDRHNKLSLDDIGYLDNNEAGMRAYLQRFFVDDQLRDVERAFEGWGDFGDWNGPARPADRMRAIAQNIIRNKGRFVGSQLLNGSSV